MNLWVAASDSGYKKTMEAGSDENVGEFAVPVACR
jgi:hypothetical protein